MFFGMDLKQQKKVWKVILKHGFKHIGLSVINVIFSFGFQNTHNDNPGIVQLNTLFWKVSVS